MSSSPSSSSSVQRDHYNAIHDEYDAHYGDESSLEYRRRFFLDPLLKGLDLGGLDVADLAAGSGYTTRELLARYPTVRPVGFDISDEACRAYEEATGCPAHRLDLTREVQLDRRFDVAIVIGGLHHCVTGLDKVLENVAALLRPGGLFLMVEPNRDCWLEPLRRVWYRRDRYFEASTEAALSHDAMLRSADRLFEGVSASYGGGPAYFLIYNSLVLRIPRGAKRFIVAPLLQLERWFNRLPGTVPFPFFVARWRRRPETEAAPAGEASLGRRAV